jgi:hypothetical protein
MIDELKKITPVHVVQLMPSSLIFAQLPKVDPLSVQALPVDLKALHAKIGEFALESGFLEGAHQRSYAERAAPRRNRTLQCSPHAGRLVRVNADIPEADLRRLLRPVREA